MTSELKRLIDQVSREKSIDRQTLIHTLEEAIKSAIKKKYGSKLDLDVTFNEEFGEIEAFQFKEVVEVVTDPEKQVSVEEALKLDPESTLATSSASAWTRTLSAVLPHSRPSRSSSRR